MGNWIQLKEETEAEAETETETRIKKETEIYAEKWGKIYIFALFLSGLIVACCLLLVIAAKETSGWQLLASCIATGYLPLQQGAYFSIFLHATPKGEA